MFSSRNIIRPCQDILATVPGAAKHAKIPPVTFTRRIGQIRIALEYNPSGATRAANPPIVHRTLASLLIFHRPEPGFKSKRGARARVVFGEPGDGGSGISIPIMVSDRAIVGSPGERAGSRVTHFGGMSRMAARAQIPQVHRDVRAGGDFIQPQVDNRIVGLNQRRIRRAPIGVRSVLIVSQDLGRRQIGGIECELIDGAEEGV